MKKKNFLKKVLIYFTCAMLLSVCGCVPPQTEEEEELIIPDGFTQVDLKGSTGVPVDGIGVEFDPHYFSQNMTRSISGLDEDGWELICERVQKMRLDKFRVMVLPQWLEPVNDNGDASKINWNLMTPDSLEMQSLYKLLDLAEESGIDVNLVFWGVPHSTQLYADNFLTKQYFMGANNLGQNWVVAPKGDMVSEWCENISAYMQLLLKGYTCITEITPYNEPNWAYQIDDNTGHLDEYMEMCALLDARFKADGIRDKVRFNLVDADDVWMEAGTTALNGIADLMNTHTYIFGYDDPNSDALDWTKNNVAITSSVGLDYFVGEFGSDMTVGATRQTDIDYYERGVLMVRNMVNFFNGGASGMSYWSLFDQYNNKRADYNEMMQTGLWMSAKEEYTSEPYYGDITEDFQVRDQYYAVSLMTRHIERGAEVFPLDIDHDFIAGSAFLQDDGYVYVLANGSDEDKKFSIPHDKKGSFDMFIYQEGKLPSTDALIRQSLEITTENKCVSFELPANTVVLLKEN